MWSKNFSHTSLSQHDIQEGYSNHFQKPWENQRDFTDEPIHHDKRDFSHNNSSNNNTHTEIKKTYCLYVRKSSEDDERQALSIESQIESMRRIAERDNLSIVEVIRESRSAKASWVREWFNALMEGLRQQRYNSILSWAPDRLSRNAWDLGSVVDLMDAWLLHEIRTNGQVFKNAPNEKFLLMILCSQAKLENDNRSINVIRWLKTKADLGHLPHKAPLGYLNQRSYLRNGGKIILDPERAPYIKIMFEKVAYEGMSGRSLQRWLENETPMRTRSGKPIVISAIYTILNNPMYYGSYEYPKGSGHWCKGTYEPIITKELYDEVQDHLNLSPRYRPRNKNFEFTKIMKCWLCWSGITAQEKFKKLIGYKEPKSYVYYHCSKYHDHHCSNSMIREDALIIQLLDMVDTLDLDTLSLSDSLREEIRRYSIFQSQLLKKDNRDIISPQDINLRDYIKYMIANWSKDEKREILSMIQGEIILTDKIVTVQRIFPKNQKKKSAQENQQEVDMKSWNSPATIQDNLEKTPENTQKPEKKKIWRPRKQHL